MNYEYIRSISLHSTFFFIFISIIKSNIVQFMKGKTHWEKQQQKKKTPYQRIVGYPFSKNSSNKWKAALISVISCTAIFINVCQTWRLAIPRLEVDGIDNLYPQEPFFYLSSSLSLFHCTVYLCCYLELSELPNDRLKEGFSCYRL